VGIVHLGLGAFFRAHGAIYVEEVMAKSGGDWGIVGVSLMSPTQRDLLAPQDFAYTALELGPGGETPRVVEVVQNVLVAREDPEAVLAAMAYPGVRIVSLTVTEKGYCHEPSTGRLNRDHPDILHDLAHPDAPRSAPGYLVRALARRRADGLRPFTVLCCDNLPENGRVVLAVTLDLARMIDPALADWIEAEAAFPATMVDRIVPATKPEDIERLTALTGVTDLSPVMHEPFRQWVVEDTFVDDARPDLGAVGVQLVDDVTPFELMKLRCLNGTHSALAYLGYLAGFETIADTVDDPVFAGFVRHLWRAEIIPSFAPPEGVDLYGYADELFARYANPAIRHRTWQIAMDGSQKLPQRILGTLADNLAANRPSPGLTLAVAAWMRRRRTARPGADCLIIRCRSG
jgi:fructuronate reductase